MGSSLEKPVKNLLRWGIWQLLRNVPQQLANTPSEQILSFKRRLFLGRLRLRGK